MSTVPAEGDLRHRVREVLDRHWVPDGYTLPNAARYPFAWLWDSCFHAVLWAELGDERALVELASVFRWQAPSGFVPHVNYERAPDAHADLWGRRNASSITQPPMFGHAVAELRRRGFAVPDDVVDRARRGLRFLLRDRPRVDGLVVLCHPWESGADDSPRWDDWCPPAWDVGRWYDRKGALVASIEYGPDGSALRNDGFRCGAAGFNALVAFNALELADAVDDDDLRREAAALAEALDGRWDRALATWVDAGEPPEGAPGGSSRVRTADALLGALVTPDERVARAALAQTVDGAALGGAFGPAGVHRDEPVFDPAAYWRGSTWPQLAYLLWLAASRRGVPEVATALAAATRRGAAASGLAEHWHPDTGAPLGAVPQSWSGLALLMD